MRSVDQRLQRLEQSASATSPASAVDSNALFRTLEALGLAFWDGEKSFWSPTNPPLMKQLLRERLAARHG
jgi:hypothetical protein